MIQTFYMKFTYAIILIAALLFSVLYSGEFSILFLCIIIMIPIFLKISLLYIRFRLNISIKTPVVSYYRNKPQTVQLVIENKCIFPISKAAAKLTCSSVVTGEQIPIAVTFPVPAKNVTIVELTITIPHCGLTEIKLNRFEITDYIRLLKKSIRKTQSISVLTLPSGTELNYKIHVPCSVTDEESNVYSKLHAGDDPSEIYRIREYHPGDMPKRIHWKLSSRTDTMWVKEYSLPIKQRAAILIDYSNSSNPSADLMDSALEAAYSLSMALVKQEVPVVIYWLSEKSQKLVWNDIHSVSELNDCFTTLLSNLPVEDSKELLTQASDLLAIHSTNAIYYCTPNFDVNEIERCFKTFYNNHFYIITSNSSSLSQNSSENKNIIFIREESISENLKKLSTVEVIRE